MLSIKEASWLDTYYYSLFMGYERKMFLLRKIMFGNARNVFQTTLCVVRAGKTENLAQTDTTSYHI